MAVAGLYRRILPSPPAIEFASSEGKQLFSEALQSGTMEGFFKLISYFQTQSEPAYCGLASLSMVLNALSIDPGRKWKGPWRWFDESMLDCCEPLEKIKAEGITFGKVACLAHCAGAKVEAFHASQSTLSDFRNHVMKCTSSEDCHLITSYHRKAFKQTGTGHFSPIGGYHAGRDMALILDVARFKYPPHWVPLTLLWEAMNSIDEATGNPRGFMLISKLHRAPSLLYTLSCKHESWAGTTKYLIDDVPILLKSEGLNNVPEVLSVIFKSLPADAGDFIKWVAEVRREEGKMAATTVLLSASRPLLYSACKAAISFRMNASNSLHRTFLYTKTFIGRKTARSHGSCAAIASMVGRKAKKREIVIPDPDYRIPLVLLGIAGGFVYQDNLLPAATVGLLGLLLLFQTTRVRFVFDEEALEVKVGDQLQESGENVFVGGKNRWKYSTFVNWELWWPNFPILVYFKETQTKPEGQIHFFPVIFNGKQLYDVMVERAGPSKTSVPN